MADKCANPACENDATTAITLFGQAVGMFCADCNQIVTDRAVAFGLLDKIVATAGETSIDINGGVPLESPSQWPGTARTSTTRKQDCCAGSAMRSANAPANDLEHAPGSTERDPRGPASRLGGLEAMGARQRIDDHTVVRQPFRLENSWTRGWQRDATAVATIDGLSFRACWSSLGCPASTRARSSSSIRSTGVVTPRSEAGQG